MPRRIPLPPRLTGTAFRVDEHRFHGLTPDRLRSRDLQRPSHGVRSVGLDLDSLLGRCDGLRPVLGERHVFSHVTAARLWGVPLPRALEADAHPLHVSSLGGTRMRRDGVVGHELDAGTPVELAPAGLFAVAASATWCHLAEVAAHRTIRFGVDALVAAGDALVSGRRVPGGGRTRPLCSVDDLRQAVIRHGARRGARLLAEALPRIRVGVDAPTETRLRLAIVDAGLPEPEIGVEVDTPEGTMHPDLCYVAARIAFEYEGEHHREDVHQWRYDFVRVRALQSVGWLVIRVNADDLATPAARTLLVAQIRRSLAART